jgi:hypothetical protein
MRKPTFTASSAGPPNDQFLASKISAYHISTVQIAYRLGQEALRQRLLSTDNIPDDLQAQCRCAGLGYVVLQGGCLSASSGQLQIRSAGQIGVNRRLVAECPMQGDGAGIGVDNGEQGVNHRCEPAPLLRACCRSFCVQCAPGSLLPAGFASASALSLTMIHLAGCRVESRMKNSVGAFGSLSKTRWSGVTLKVWFP